MKLITGPHPIFDTDEIKEVREIYTSMNGGNISIHLECGVGKTESVKNQLPKWVHDEYNIIDTATCVVITTKK